MAQSLDGVPVEALLVEVQRVDHRLCLGAVAAIFAILSITGSNRWRLQYLAHVLRQRVVEHVEGSHAALVVGNGVLGVPVAAGKIEEVIALEKYVFLF